MAMPGAATHSTSGDQDRCERLVGAVTDRGLGDTGWGARRFTYRSKVVRAWSVALPR